MLATVSGVTPFIVQYVGRHISHWNVNELKTELLPEVSIGRIQVGTAPGDSAQRMVPGFWVPVAAWGTDPIPPGTVMFPPTVLPEELVVLLLLQAASAVMLATATTSPPMVLLWKLIGLPSSRR
jgi:hypothetical protein